MAGEGVCVNGGRGVAQAFIHAKRGGTRVVVRSSSSNRERTGKFSKSFVQRAARRREKG